MFTFLQFSEYVTGPANYLLEYATPKFYTLRRVDTDSANRIHTVLKNSKDIIPDSFKPISNYHVSVVTSGTEVSDYKIDHEPIKLTPLGWNVWGASDSYLVIVCEPNPKLTGQLKTAEKSGAELTWPIDSYKPHISVMMAKGKEPHSFMSQLPLPATITVGPEEIHQWNPAH